MRSSDKATQKRLGGRIADIRRGKGLTQEQLAEKATVHRDTVAFIENGLRWPSATTLSAIAKALGVRLEDLFKGV